MEQHVPRHRRAPGRHVHEVDDQSWFVIAGRGRWFIGDQVIEAGPGDFVHGPHGIAHAFSADTDDLHVLVITAPAGLEGLFAAIGVDATEPTHPPADLPEGPDDPDLARRYGTTALGPETRWTPAARSRLVTPAPRERASNGPQAWEKLDTGVSATGSPGSIAISP